MIKENVPLLRQQIAELTRTLKGLDGAAERYDDAKFAMDRASDTLETRQVNSLMTAIENEESPSQAAWNLIVTTIASTTVIR